MNVSAIFGWNGSGLNILHNRGCMEEITFALCLQCCFMYVYVFWYLYNYKEYCYLSYGFIIV